MRSVRLPLELEDRISQAASVAGESVSEFLRRAAVERADRVLQDLPSDQLSSVLGVIRGGGGRARRTGEAFADALVERSSP